MKGNQSNNLQVSAFFFFKHVSVTSGFSSGSHALFTGPINLFFSTKFSLKMSPNKLFTHLKIILLQCFQFSIFNFNKISSIQTDPMFSLLKKHVSKP